MSAARSDSIGLSPRWEPTSATSITTASWTLTSEQAGCRTRAWFPTSCSRALTGAASRTSPIRRGPAIFRRAMAYRSPTGIATATWTFLSCSVGGIQAIRHITYCSRIPAHGHHWLKVKLVGSTTNRSALGALIHVELKQPDGTSRSIYRTVGNNGSFGGNSLIETIGLGNVASVARLTVKWPASKSSQTYVDVAADQAIEITEGRQPLRTLRQAPLRLPPATRQTVDQERGGAEVNPRRLRSAVTAINIKVN